MFSTVYDAFFCASELIVGRNRKLRFRLVATTFKIKFSVTILKFALSLTIPFNACDHLLVCYFLARCSGVARVETLCGHCSAIAEGVERDA